MRPLVLLLAAATIAGCGGGDGDGRERTAATPEPDCGQARPESPVAAPERLIAPPGTEFASIERAEDGVKQAQGFMPLTPDEFVRFADERDDVAVLFRESEGGDAEVQFSDARIRAFWSVVRACPGGSRFSVVYDRELAPGIIREQIEGGEPGG